MTIEEIYPAEDSRRKLSSSKRHDKVVHALDLWKHASPLVKAKMLKTMKQVHKARKLSEDYEYDEEEEEEEDHPCAVGIGAYLESDEFTSTPGYVYSGPFSAAFYADGAGEHSRLFYRSFDQLDYSSLSLTTTLQGNASIVMQTAPTSSQVAILSEYAQGVKVHWPADADDETGALKVIVL